MLTSPLSRAAETTALAGYPSAEVDPDLREWDYGDLEGRLTADIRAEHPGWTIWRGPWPGGETIDQVAARADRVLTRARAAGGDVLLVAHGHLLRVLAARWLGLPATSGGLFALGTAIDLDPRLGARGARHRALERGLPPRLTVARRRAGSAAGDGTGHRRDPRA